MVYLDPDVRTLPLDPPTLRENAPHGARCLILKQLAELQHCFPNELLLNLDNLHASFFV